MDNACVFCRCCKVIRKKTKKAETRDDPLRNWEEWLNERRKVQQKLADSLKKPTGELLMNINEEGRRVKEEKMIFAYSQIITDFDKLRGNPDFWRLPPGLQNTECAFNKDPIYFAVKSKEDKNEIPIIEYVDTSPYIFEEKNVLPRTRSLYDRWQKNSYRKAYMKKMFSKLCLIEPHHPDLSQLIVIGKGLNNRSEDYQVSNFAKSYKFVENSQISFEVYSIPKLLFIINGTTISSKDKLCDGYGKIRVFFNLDEIPKVPVVKTVKFENRGLKTLRFYWRPFEKFRTFKDIAPKQAKMSPFYFDNTEILLVTGRDVELPILFKPKTPGHYNESWEITTMPKIWKEDYKLIVSLQGIVYDGNLEEEMETVRKMLDVNTRNTLIKEILNSTLKKLKYSKTSHLTYTYSETEIFECMNQETYGAQKRTKYLYNKNMVGELKKFHQVMSEATGDNQWNYSIDELKVVTRRKDVLDYVADLMDKCLNAKHRLQKLKSPETATLSDNNKSKFSMDNTEENPIESKSLGTNYRNLEKLLSRLERPGMIVNGDRDKFSTAYFVLRSYLSKMCNALEELDGVTNKAGKNYPSFDFKKATKMDDLPERLVFERFDDIWIERMKRVPPEPKSGFPMTPKPKHLVGVSPADAKLLHEAYLLGQPKSEKPKNKEKNAPQNRKSKEKIRVKSISAETPITPECAVREGFDPFAEVSFSSISQAQGSSTRTVAEIPHETEEKYNDKPTSDKGYEKYLIVYTHLCAAVDAVISTLETMRKNDVPTQLLGDLIEDRLRVEKYIEIDEKIPIKVEGGSENNLYFRHLLDVHLNKNEKINKYFVLGETAPSVQETPPHSEKDFQPLPNSHETLVVKQKEESHGSLNSACVQTSFTNEDWKGFSSEESLREIRDDSTISVEKQPSDIFYFIDDEEE